MNLEIKWMRPLQLTEDTDGGLIYTCDIDKLPSAPGWYVFGRMFGKNLEALYVGKAGKLRERIIRQFNNLKLMKHLEDAANGKRVVLVGRFISRPAQQEGKCLPLVEKALIRYYLSEGHDLVNVAGTKLSQHSIRSSGTRLVARKMLVDRK